MLSPLLSGEKTFEQIVIHGDGWYVKHGVTLYKGHKITAIDRDAKTVTSAAGVTAPYDKLIIATGSMPIVIPVPGSTLAGVLTYRDLDDVQAMLIAAKSRGSAVVIGGGLLGLEAAAGLKEQGMDVTVVHLMPTLMEKQLDTTAGHLLQRAVEARGIKVITKANTEAIRGTSKVEGVLLADGTELPADIVVMAVGIRPNAALAKDAGLIVKRGIVVSPSMQTSDPSIFAVGECAEAQGECFGLVAPLYEMANVVAAQLAGDTSAEFTPSATATKLKVTGINLFSAGDFTEGKDREEIVLRDASRGIYKRLVIKDDKIAGAVFYGDTADSAWFFDLLKRGVDISEMRETLIFGPSYAGGTALDPMAAVAALPDDAEICGCNGVCKGKIVAAIADQGLKTLDDVRAHTKASASCGSCTGLVEQLMKATLGDVYNPAAVQPMCPCTSLGHDEVRRLIIAKELKSIPDLMQALEWRTSCGCAKCRPALNFYLVANWPGEYQDDSQSRYINDRNEWYDNPEMFNVVGEIRGTELPNEVVIIGGHFDSWHASTGATDNGGACSIALEALRLLKATNAPLKRTVRVCLWNGEEQGLIGSRLYVAKHFGGVRGAPVAGNPRGVVQPVTRDHSRFQAYFNLDNGAGSIRGVYAQGNQPIVPIFREWIEPVRDLGMTHITTRSTGGTDHLSFDQAGLPGFQMIQDPLEYEPKHHHTNLDFYEALQPEDMRRNAVLMATFAMLAGNHPGKLPRKPRPPADTPPPPSTSQRLVQGTP